VDIKTKLNLGDQFFYIGYNTFTGKEHCKACDGDGKVFYKDDSSDECPRCYGKGYLETYGKENWHVLNNDPSEWDYMRPVGKIGVEIEGGKRKQSIKVTYTPKGMGNYYYEENCFATLDEATQECIRRNGALKKEA